MSSSTDGSRLRAVEPAVLRGESATGVRPAALTQALATRLPNPQQVHDAAQAAGYAAGWAAGGRAAAEQMAAQRARADAEAQQMLAAYAARLDAAVAALERAAADLERRAAQPAAEAEEVIATVAYAVAEAVIGRELATASDPAGDAVRRALALAPQGCDVTVRLAPEDAAALEGVELGSAARQVTVVPDPSLRSGDAVAECGATTFDARIDAALARIKEVLAA
jgi:flagellar assembly protein FliH